MIRSYFVPYPIWLCGGNVMLRTRRPLAKLSDRTMAIVRSGDFTTIYLSIYVSAKRPRSRLANCREGLPARGICCCLYVRMCACVCVCVWAYIYIYNIYSSFLLLSMCRSVCVQGDNTWGQSSYRWSGADKVNKNKLAVPEEHLTQVGREVYEGRKAGVRNGGRVGLKKGELLTETSILKIQDIQIKKNQKEKNDFFLVQLPLALYLTYFISFCWRCECASWSVCVCVCL